MKALFIILALLSSNLWSQESYQAEVWGKIIEVKEKDQIWGYRYFILLIKDGKKIAKPVEVKNTELIAKLKTANNKMAKVKGVIEVKEMAYQEEMKKVPVFIIDSIDFLSLNDLAIANANEDKFYKVELLQKEKKSSKLSGLSDNVTNSVIFASGALLLGSIIGPMIK